MDAASVYEIASAEEPTTPYSKTQAPPRVLSSALLAAILSAAAAGTGGVARPHALTTQTFTGPVAPVCSVNLRQDEEGCLLGIQEKIAAIKHYLSLNMTDLAAVLKVGRPTVYTWATAPVTVKSRHRERVDALYEIARDWRALSSTPMGRILREPLADRATMIDLLSADKLAGAALSNAMLQAKEMQDRTEKRLTVTEVAKKAGVKLAFRPRRNWRSSGDLDL